MQKNKPLVSIIINCYNGEQFLPQCIKSIQKQTYKNFEVIFWNNKSTDKSSIIYGKIKDKRFKYFLAKNKTNLYKARNLALQKTKGKLIGFLDVDDLWLPNKLYDQISYFKDETIGVVYSKLWVLNEKTKKKKIHVNNELASGYIYDKIIKNYNIGLVTTLVRKKTLLSLNKFFDIRFNHIGDFDLFIRLSKICKFKAIQHPTAIYRVHSKMLTIVDKKKAIDEFELWINENKKKINKYNFKQIYATFLLRKFIFFKMNSKYSECLKIIIKSRNLKIIIKKFLILIIPILFLKKIIWY